MRTPLCLFLKRLIYSLTKFVHEKVGPFLTEPQKETHHNTDMSSHHILFFVRMQCLIRPCLHHQWRISKLSAEARSEMQRPWPSTPFPTSLRKLLLQKSCTIHPIKIYHPSHGSWITTSQRSKKTSAVDFTYSDARNLHDPKPENNTAKSANNQKNPDH